MDGLQGDGKVNRSAHDQGRFQASEVVQRAGSRGKSSIRHTVMDVHVTERGALTKPYAASNFP